MPGLLIGYACVSTDGQDLTAQRDVLAALGVASDRVYVDHGLTGTNRARPGPRQAMAACGRLLVNVLAMVAEFESDLIRMRTLEPAGV